MRGGEPSWKRHRADISEQRERGQISTQIGFRDKGAVAAAAAICSAARRLSMCFMMVKTEEK
jgi:hypothetical protein